MNGTSSATCFFSFGSNDSFISKNYEGLRYSDLPPALLSLITGGSVRDVHWVSPKHWEVDNTTATMKLFRDFLFANRKTLASFHKGLGLARSNNVRLGSGSTMLVHVSLWHQDQHKLRLTCSRRPWDLQATPGSSHSKTPLVPPTSLGVPQYLPAYRKYCPSSLRHNTCGYHWDLQIHT